MTRIKYDINLMKFMSLFESITNSKLKDCFDANDLLVFVVENGEIAKAIGRKGSNVMRIEGILKRKIKIVEFNEDKIRFIRNFIYPIEAEEIKEENNIVFIRGRDTKTKGLLIGRDSKNLDNLINVVRRYFEVGNIKVV